MGVKPRTSNFVNLDPLGQPLGYARFAVGTGGCRRGARGTCEETANNEPPPGVARVLCLSDPFLRHGFLHAFVFGILEDVV